MGANFRKDTQAFLNDSKTIFEVPMIATKDGNVVDTNNPFPVSGSFSFSGGLTDAFGRLRVSQPYTLFDSQNRYAADNQFDTSTVTGGSTTYLPNESSLRMDVTTASGAEVVRQTFRSFPYQPGKALLVLATFVMNAAKTNLRQRVGYFGTQNGLYFELNNTTKAFVIRTYISGSVDNTTRRS
jgi:hypothetical protein